MTKIIINYSVKRNKNAVKKELYGTYAQVTLPLFSTYFNDFDHSSLTDNMFTALKSC